MQTRLSRQQRRAQTRQQLIQAAAEVFARRGFHAAVVDEIAEAAGYSSGALYSNFDGKDDLLLAVLEQTIARSAQIHRSAADRGGTGIPERVESVARNWLKTLEERPAEFILLIELWSHAARRPELRERFAERYDAVRDALADIIATGAQQLGLTLALPARDLATIVDALGDGFALQKIVNPEGTRDELLIWAFQRLFAAALKDDDA